MKCIIHHIIKNLNKDFKIKIIKFLKTINQISIKDVRVFLTIIKLLKRSKKNLKNRKKIRIRKSKNQIISRNQILNISKKIETIIITVLCIRILILENIKTVKK